MSNLDRMASIPRAPTHALHMIDNWDGEGDRVYLLAFERDGQFYSFETGKLVMEYQGDAVLQAWPLTAPHPSDWISASERVPTKDDGEVLVLMDDGRCEIAWASYWSGSRTDFAGWTFRDPDEDRVPTHWQPLPVRPALTATKGGL
jgi:hypothetical protein